MKQSLLLDVNTTKQQFIKAWYKWQCVGVPVSNFRSRRANAPTYDIEHDLDHQSSYLYLLGLSGIGREKIDYLRLTCKELFDLECIEKHIEQCNLSDKEKGEFTEYINATRALLEAISQL